MSNSPDLCDEVPNDIFGNRAALNLDGRPVTLCLMHGGNDKLRATQHPLPELDLSQRSVALWSIYPVAVE